MASTGYEKWVKYFKNRKVKTTLNCPGDVKVYDKNNNVIDCIPGHFAITVKSTDNYNSKYPIQYKLGTVAKSGYVSQQYIKKPLNNGSTETLQLKAKDLITLGKTEHFRYGSDKIEVKVFSNTEFLSASIQTGLADNEYVSIDIINTFNGYLKSNTYNQILWEKKVLYQEKNELGKYVGELIPGLMMFSNTTPFTSDTLCKNAIGFAVPTDPSFSGIDSFIVFENDEYIGISNKYGRGALASFFNNILPLAHLIPYSESESVLYSITTYHNKTNSNKELVYEYGMREILGIPTGIIPRAISLYEEIQSGNISPSSHIAIMKIKSLSEDKRIIDNLPWSVTSFFCREISKRLNNCELSKKQILKMIETKNVYQVNLNNSLWNTGTVDYSVTRVGATEVKFSGAKSPITNLEAKWGMINYQIVK